MGPFSETTVSTCSVETNKNIASETKDAESPHPKATALDGTDIECTACGWKQMVFTLEIE